MHTLPEYETAHLYNVANIKTSDGVWKWNTSPGSKYDNSCHHNIHDSKYHNSCHHNIHISDKHLGGYVCVWGGGELCGLAVKTDTFLFGPLLPDKLKTKVYCTIALYRQVNIL